MLYLYPCHRDSQMFHTVRDPLAALRRSVTDLLGSSSAAPAATEPNAVCSAEGLAAMKLQVTSLSAPLHWRGVVSLCVYAVVCGAQCRLTAEAP